MGFFAKVNVPYILLALVFSLSSAAVAQTHPEAAQIADTPSDPRAESVAQGYAAELTSILQVIVTDNGLVRYRQLETALREPFRRVVAAVADFDADQLKSTEDKLAFWMNAYNVRMLQNILEHPDVEDIMANGYAERFFNTPVRVAGHEVTLNQIEHVILRREDGPEPVRALRVDRVDPRIHVGINCAAVSCPPLRKRAFTPANVQEELDRAMRDFTRRERHVRLEGSTLVLSSILDWFGADFEHSGRPAGDYLLSYMPADRQDYRAIRSRLQGRSAADLKKDPAVRFEYDWTVSRAPDER